MHDERKWCVYVHISPSNKYYVGITSQKPKDRWRNGKGYKSCKGFYNAILKYGWENIQHEIIAERLTEDEAKNFEVLLISKLNSNQKQHGYNITSGGNGTTGVRHYGAENPFWGKKHTQETKSILRESMSSQWNNGKFDDMCKPIYQFDIDGNYIAEYASIREAEAKTGIDHSVISRVCKKKLHYTHGFTWAYQDECNDFNAFKQTFSAELKHKKTLCGKHMWKPVNLYDLTGIFIAQFASAAELARKLNVHKDTVSYACRHHGVLQRQYRCNYAQEG